MSNRRSFLKHSAAAASALSFPLVAGAQPKAVKVGILHPVTGALAYSGGQCRAGALMAIARFVLNSESELKLVTGTAEDAPAEEAIQRVEDFLVSAALDLFGLR